MAHTQGRAVTLTPGSRWGGGGERRWGTLQCDRSRFLGHAAFRLKNMGLNLYRTQTYDKVAGVLWVIKNYFKKIRYVTKTTYATFPSSLCAAFLLVTGSWASSPSTRCSSTCSHLLSYTTRALPQAAAGPLGKNVVKIGSNHTITEIRSTPNQKRNGSQWDGI